MKILVAEDEPTISRQYKLALQEKGHHVIVTGDGEECLRVYQKSMKDVPDSAINQDNLSKNRTPFDVVILDYRMPKKDGLQTAKEILQLQPGQRIIFASAYVVDTLREAARELHQIVELLQKPFGLDYLVEIVEDTQVYMQLEKLNVRVKELKNHNLTLSQLVDLLAGVKKLQATVASAH
ncbi:MAG TPA: response regulator [Nitrososphaera sp.]|jgi:CheY-like chemotaxis protein